jgi:molecular chaperone DnaK (HSP70)
MAIAGYGRRMPERTDQALAALCDAVERAQERLAQVQVRTTHLRTERAAGREYVDIVRAEERPLVVEMLTDVLDELARAGAEFRRAEARVLHASGMSHEAIGQLFGVTRQRVGALLQGAGS